MILTTTIPEELPFPALNVSSTRTNYGYRSTGRAVYHRRKPYMTRRLPKSNAQKAEPLVLKEMKGRYIDLMNYDLQMRAGEARNLARRRKRKIYEFCKVTVNMEVVTVFEAWSTAVTRRKCG